MDLCMSIGCTLGELGRRMSSQEFSLWLALWDQEPAAVRADIRAGVIAATVANYAGKVLPDGEAALQPRDFLKFSAPGKQEEPDPMQPFRGR